MPNTKYDVDYFIKKFEAIPEKKWCTGFMFGENGTRCALGHCGAKGVFAELPPEGRALDHLFRNILGVGVVSVNDNAYECTVGETPKERVLLQLYNLKGYLE